MDLRGGSLLRADGGFLIMYAWKQFRSPSVARPEAHAQSHRLEIQPAEMFFRSAEVR